MRAMGYGWTPTLPYTVVLQGPVDGCSSSTVPKQYTAASGD